MKTYIYNKTYLKLLAAIALVFSVTSCSFDEQVDPNRASLEGVLTNAPRKTVGTSDLYRTPVGFILQRTFLF